MVLLRRRRDRTRADPDLRRSERYRMTPPRKPFSHVAVYRRYDDPGRGRGEAPMRKRIVLVSFVAVVALAAGACSSSSKNATTTTTTTAASTGASSAEGSTPNITIKGFAFTVTPAKVGTITIRNDDTTKHSVTADDGTFDVEVPAGGTATIDVTKPGTYAFHCKFHPTMKGTLVVT
jgi:plastocyanin